MKNTLLEVKAGDLLNVARENNIDIIPENLSMLSRVGKSHDQLSKTSPRFNHVMNIGVIQAISDSSIKASDFNAIGYFPPNGRSVDLRDNLFHLSTLASAPVMAPSPDSTNAHKQSFEAHQGQTTDCWNRISNDLDSVDMTNRAEVRSVSNQLAWIPTPPWMDDLTTSKRSLKDHISDAKTEFKESYKGFERPRVDNQVSSPAP